MILGTHTFEDSYNPIDEKEVNVLCSQTLSRTVPCFTNDYVIDKNLINTSETSWRDVYAENDTPVNILNKSGINVRGVELK